MTKTLQQAIHKLTKTETQLTINIIQQITTRLHLHDPQLLDGLYQTVIYYTQNWPKEQGWDTSDTSTVLNTYIRDHHPLTCLSCLQPLNQHTFTKNDGLCNGCTLEPTKNQRQEIEADQDRAINSNEALTIRQRIKLGHTS